jgi:uncharacterized protein (DUF934 family)
MEATPMNFLDADQPLPHDVLWLDNVDDVREHAALLPTTGAVALRFPKWTDGRAYSQARLLRSRLHFMGDIWATGDVVVDMLPLLQRSGFSAVQLRDGQSREGAQRALGYFDGHYQTDLLSKLPAFARGAAPAARAAK